MKKILISQSSLIKKFFEDYRFHMTDTFFDGIDGEGYVDNINEPNFACIIINKWCFINGKCNKDIAVDFFKNLPSNVKVINPGGNWEKYCVSYYNENIEKYTRYLTKNNQTFDEEKLKDYIDNLNPKYHLELINSDIYEKIINTDSFCTNIEMNKDFKNTGLGFVCFEGEKIVGVVVSNLRYKGAVELNIKVNPDKRKEGIGSSLDSIFILECLKRNIYPVVDCANLNVWYLAQKVGYQMDSEYNVYLIKSR